MEAFFDRDCTSARELLSLSLDGELDALERRRLDRHLRDCVACRLHGARVEAITRTLRSAPLERPSISIPAYLYWRRRLLRTVIPAAAALVAVTLGLSFMQGSAGRNGATVPVVSVSAAPHQARISYAIQPQPQPPVYSDVVETH